MLIESGGDNLTLTFSPALVDFFIYVIDVAAGDKIPRKNGPGITQSDILVINKTDLAPYVGASLEVMDHDSRLMRGDKPFVFTNCKTGEGIDELVRLIRENVLFDLEPEAGQSMTAPHQAPELPVPGRAEAAPYRISRQERLPPTAASSGEATDRSSRDGPRAPLIVQRALYCDEGMPGASVRADHLQRRGHPPGRPLRHCASRSAPAAFAHVTTQAATKIHEMDANHASQTQEISPR